MMSFWGAPAPTKCSGPLSLRVSVCNSSVISSYSSYASHKRSFFAVGLYLGWGPQPSSLRAAGKSADLEQVPSPHQQGLGEG